LWNPVAETVAYYISLLQTNFVGFGTNFYIYKHRHQFVKIFV